MISRERGLSAHRPGLQHHLLGIEADALVRAGVVVTPPNRILVRPRQGQLQVVAGHALVHDDRPRVARRGQIEVRQVRRRHPDVAVAVLFEPRLARQIVGDAEERQRREVGGQRQVPIVADRAGTVSRSLASRNMRIAASSFADLPFASPGRGRSASAASARCAAARAFRTPRRAPTPARPSRAVLQA